MPTSVTVAIPVLNGGDLLDEVLDAVTAQTFEGRVEILVCDSGSSDGSPRRARSHGAEVITIEPGTFGHGRTRNLLMARAQGDHVALLTQDAVPAGEDWLSRLVSGFGCAASVGLTFGPYRARADASLMVTRELATWFDRFSPDGRPRVDALASPDDRSDAKAFLGLRGYFTDANGCVSREAWQQVPFRDVAYAEDHLLAQDMLRAGFAKVFIPDAVVVHSHEYSAAQWLRRSFDESRAMREIYGFSPAGDLRSAVRNLRGNVGADLRWSREHDAGRASVARVLAGSLAHHGARTTGAVLGDHARRLPAPLRAQLSLESRR